MHLDTVMTVTILLFIQAHAGRKSSAPDGYDACEDMEETVASNCQASCRSTSLGSIFCCDCKPKKECSCATCICTNFPCISANIGKDCIMCSTDACTALTSTELPTTDSSTKSVYSNSTTIISSTIDYSHTRNSMQDITSVNSIPQTNGSMDNSLRSTTNYTTPSNAIIGAVVGGVLAIVLILVAAFLIFRHLRRRKRASAQGMTNMTNGYQHMPTGAPRTPVAPYDNLMNTPPSEHNPEPAQQMGPGFNNNLNGDASYDNSGERVNNYDEIRVHEYVEITDGGDVVTGPSGRVSLFGAVAPPGESGETTLLDNEFYGDNASNVRSSNENEGETTVIDNDYYE